MKIALFTHGFPPELSGGVEGSTHELALSLARRGHGVYVASGTLEGNTESAPSERASVRRETLRGPGGEAIEVARIARPDLYFDHWHKSRSAAAAGAIRELLREWRPDVVHVQHWIRLTRDLLALAAREKIPGIVSLHDAFVSCPIVFRVRPDTRLACDVQVGAHPCIACAGQVPPRTPWVRTEAAFMLLAERQRDLGRELELARATIVPSAAHGRLLERTLGLAPGALSLEVIAPRSVPAFAPGLRAPRDPRRLVFASWSQIARHKGVDVLIEAFLAARANLAGRVELQLELFGAEPEAAFAADLRARSAGHGVHWRGAFQPADLRARLDPAARVFVNASRAHESYGLSVDEAARLGLGLLLADAPAFLERAQGVARFFRGGDSADLAERMRELALDGAQVEALQRAAEKFALALPDAQAICARHEALYARALERGAPAVAALDWFEQRMSLDAEQQWDRALSARSPGDLGL